MEIGDQKYNVEYLFLSQRETQIADPEYSPECDTQRGVRVFFTRGLG